MGFFDLFRGVDINSRLQEAREVKDAVIVDVRRPDEFSQGHIPGAVNIPLESIDAAAKKIRRKETPVYTYCLAGTRSSRAAAMLRAMGYSNVTNIGGINRYKGKIER